MQTDTRINKLELFLYGEVNRVFITGHRVVQDYSTRAYTRIISKLFVNNLTNDLFYFLFTFMFVIELKALQTSFTFCVRFFFKKEAPANMLSI